MTDNITYSLNGVLANLHILNVKLHNYHWNVFGMQFHAIHAATEAYYDFFFGQFDDVAERILQLGSKPISTAAGYLKSATLEEDTDTHFDPAYVLDKVLADFTALLAQIKETNGLAEDADDTGTVDLLSRLISWLEKEIWILKSSGAK